LFLIKAKLEDGAIKPRQVITPPPVIDLMAALKRSLAPDTSAISGTTAKESEPSPDRCAGTARPLWRELRSSHRGYF
jgi:non-homologous end joining protein Ku